MDRLKVLCFAGTYGLALLCELARLVVRSPFRWYLTVGLTSLGWIVQTVFLANLALKDQMNLPVTSAFESVMMLAWIVAFIGLYFMLHWPRQVAVGLFVSAPGSGSGYRGRLVCTQAVRLAGRGDDGILGNGSWHLPAGRHRVHVCRLRGRAHVSGPDEAAEVQAAGPIRSWPCQASSSRSA